MDAHTAAEPTLPAARCWDTLSPQDARRVAYLAQQAAEQAAMRDYMRSLPPQASLGHRECNAGRMQRMRRRGCPLACLPWMPREPRLLSSPIPPLTCGQHLPRAVQVVWEDEGAAPTAQNVARTHSRLARPAARPHASHGHSSRGYSFGSGSFSAGSSGAGSHTTGPSAPASEAGYSASGASATSEIEPANGTSAGRAQVLPSQGSLDARASLGGGGGLLPEALKRAAAKVQPGSPRRSAARAKEPFATKVGGFCIGKAVRR